jgi:hypothetical protein
VEQLVERSARPLLRRKRGRRIVTTIDIDNDVSDAFTVLDVTPAIASVYSSRSRTASTASASTSTSRR